MKLENKSEYFDYFPGETVLVSPAKQWSSIFQRQTKLPSQCIALSFSPDFVEEFCIISIPN